MAEAAVRQAIYADLEAVPAHRVAARFNEAPAPGPQPPFDAVPFPLDDFFPFDDPAAPAQPET
ncbi:hypothetical protein MMSR116_26185 [Methylobacterium mesophilicum SR1.6/6]|uniref:Uncharacterized protein n=1 Tax=Methylobacterium mesophilicum SR1.6/6 TaxID=908290 RepID=A0A6B9FRE7_9HYPH|nr:hypothetical protein [Methylobacterium mesophilicum]QGY04997.1 hypothetical protein MMSR116_26185 [Methylobacterium mesophilicum SR1.6/6]